METYPGGGEPVENADVAPAQLYRVTMTLDIDVVSRDGFSGAADEAVKAARRAMDSTSDKATVVAVSVPCA